jgi:hypothetical protein
MYEVYLNEMISVQVPALDVSELNELMEKSEKLAISQGIKPISEATKKLFRLEFNESIRTGKFKLLEE